VTDVTFIGGDMRKYTYLRFPVLCPLVLFGKVGWAKCRALASGEGKELRSGLLVKVTEKYDWEFELKVLFLETDKDEDLRILEGCNWAENLKLILDRDRSE
jgi:hypothetical protein